ncbi:hypothetical protein ACLOJK_021534 [Asimina triloba]
MFSMPIPSLHLVRSLPLISSPTPPSGIPSNCSAVFPSPLQTKNFSSSSSSRCYFSSEISGNNVGGGGSSGRDGNLAIEGRNLNFSITRKKRRYGGGPSQAEELVPILNDCSIRIPTGQLWMLLGPNGCGKSTLLKVVMPTVEADVAFGLGKFNLTPDEVQTRVENALEAVDMLEYLRRPVQTLSGGQKQRVAIAGALAESCEVLLLDELTTFLDENDQRGVLEAVKNSLGGPREVAALWVTHRLEELDYADGAVYMENGMVMMHGDVQSIRCFLNKKIINYMDLINS